MMNKLPAFEQEIKAYCTARQIAFQDNCDSFKKLDFSFGDKAAKRHFAFDVKEKRQPYTQGNWPDSGIPEPHLFILDDLAARKILAYSPNSGLVVRDNMSGRYVFFSVVDLFLMPKKRVNREIRKQIQGMKGKWMIDLRNGRGFENLAGVFTEIEAYLNSREDIFVHILECYGDYTGEEIRKGGIPRRPEHWDKDVSETR
jgi:hypothetical protein